MSQGKRADMTTRIVDINTTVLVPRQQVAEDSALALLRVGVRESPSAYQTAIHEALAAW